MYGSSFPALNSTGGRLQKLLEFSVLSVVGEKCAHDLQRPKHKMVKTSPMMAYSSAKTGVPVLTGTAPKNLSIAPIVDVRMFESVEMN